MKRRRVLSSKAVLQCVVHPNHRQGIEEFLEEALIQPIRAYAMDRKGDWWRLDAVPVEVMGKKCVVVTLSDPDAEPEAVEVYHG